METIHIRGLDGLRRKLAQAGPRAMPVLAGALFEAGHEIMAESKTEVPWDTGTLRNSGQVQKPEISGNSVRVVLGYGGAAQAYALVQHERTDLNHPRGGKAHYLSDPAKRYASNMGRRLAALMGRRLETELARGA